MAYCPDCANELAASDQRCAKCGADFTAADGWKPLDVPPEKEIEGRSLRWWQKVLWFVGFWVIIINLLKLLGADALAQTLLGIFGSILGVMWMNTRARRRSGTATRKTGPNAT